MARLIILLGPVASALGGVAVGFLADQLLVHPVGKLLMWPLSFGADAEPAAEAGAAAADKEGRGEAKDEEVKKAKGAAKKGAAAAPAGAKAEAPPASALSSASAGAKRLALGAYNHPLSLLLRLGVGLWCVRQAVPKAKEFFGYSHQLAEGFSQPSIMFKARCAGPRLQPRDARRRSAPTAVAPRPSDVHVCGVRVGAACTRARRSWWTTTVWRTGGCATTRPRTRA